MIERPAPALWIRSIRAAAVPVMSWWAGRLQRRFLAEGRPLNAEERALAERVDVRQPEQIRIVFRDEIPLPAPDGIVRLLMDAGCPVFRPAGMCVGSVVFVMPRYATPEIIAHELRHAAQYQKLGGISEFLNRYIEECLQTGYQNCALERDARAAAARAVGVEKSPLDWRMLR